MWNPQIEILKKKFRVITYDIRGHGKSDVGDGQYTIELFIDDLIELLNYLKIDKTVLCGFSIGGYIALRAIERNPERFISLILCDTKSEIDTNETKMQTYNAIKAIKNNSSNVKEVLTEEFVKTLVAPRNLTNMPELVKMLKDTILSNSPIGTCGAMLATVRRTDATPSLSKINIPTLILVGEDDILTPPSICKIMHQKIPGSKMQVISNAGHMSNLENPDEFNKYLLDFLLLST